MKKYKIESLLEIAPLLTRQNDFEQILRLVTEKSSVMFNSARTFILMVNPVTHNTIKTISKKGEMGPENHYRQLHTYLTGWVMENNDGFFSQNLKEDSRIRNDIFQNIPNGSIICSALRGMGRVMGTLLLFNESSGHIFSEDEYKLVEIYSAIISPYFLNIENIRKFFPNTLPNDNLLKKYEPLGLLGRSEKLLNLLKSIEAAANSDVRVLLEGKSGTGKELVAKAIHQTSNRVAGRFVAIDCGAIPRELIESELFGHVKGAFTGAAGSRTGLLEEANEGTIFMDEINNLPLDIQSRLLRVLQENEIRPLGANFTKKINFRVIAATSTPLKDLVEAGKFREDLFYRLYVFPIEIPTLEQRKSDIPILANYFLKKFSRQQNKTIESFSSKVLEKLIKYRWDGNIRELENAIERMVTLADPGEKVLNSGILPEILDVDPNVEDSSLPQWKFKGSLNEAVAGYETDLIRNALEMSSWNQSEAARILDISEHTIRYKMKKLGINSKNK